jgi:prevent-host-death family protein
MEYRFKSKRTLKKMADSISATEAAKNFGRLVDRVREKGTTYVVERHGRPIAQIGPVVHSAPKTLRGLVELMRTAPTLDEETLRLIEEGVKALNRPEVPRNRWAR